MIRIYRIDSLLDVALPSASFCPLGVSAASLSIAAWTALPSFGVFPASRYGSSRECCTCKGEHGCSPNHLIHLWSPCTTDWNIIYGHCWFGHHNWQVASEAVYIFHFNAWEEASLIPLVCFLTPSIVDMTNLALKELVPMFRKAHGPHPRIFYGSQSWLRKIEARWHLLEPGRSRNIGWWMLMVLNWCCWLC